MTLKFTALAAALLLLFLAPHKASGQEPPKEEIIESALQKKEKLGIKIGMSKEEVLKILGDNYKKEELHDKTIPDEVYSWYKPDGETISVTFLGGKVKAVAHKLVTETANN